MIAPADPAESIAVSLTLPLSDLQAAKQYVQSIGAWVAALNQASSSSAFVGFETK
jgi:hypothetical protein